MCPLDTTLLSYTWQPHPSEGSLATKDFTEPGWVIMLCPSIVLLGMVALVMVVMWTRVSIWASLNYSTKTQSSIDALCKGHWMHSVCLAVNYERTHHNDLTVHAKHYSCQGLSHWLCHWFLPCLQALRLDVSVFPRGWVSEVKGLGQRECTSKWQSQAPIPAILTLISVIPPTIPWYHSVSHQLIMKSCILILLSFIQ